MALLTAGFGSQLAGQVSLVERLVLLGRDQVVEERKVGVGTVLLDWVREPVAYCQSLSQQHQRQQWSPLA